MQLCRIIYYSLAALRVSSDIFAHHQEHLNCFYSFWYYTRMSLPAGIMGVLELQLCRIIYYSLAALHVSSDIFAHHQEHLNFFYSFWYYTRMSLPAGIMGVLELHLCGIIYYSLAALHVSSDIFAHRQEHLNCFYSFWYYTRMSLPAGIMGVLELQLCRIIYYSLAALHVSSDIFAHHQEHLNCFYSFWCYTRMSLPAGIMGVLQLQLCRIIYYSLAALRVSSDIFAHHEEHLNCFYSFWYYTRMSLPAGIMGVLELQLCRIIYYSLTALHVSSDIFTHHQEHLNCFYSFWYYTRMSLPLVSWECWNCNCVG